TARATTKRTAGRAGRICSRGFATTESRSYRTNTRTSLALTVGSVADEIPIRAAGTPVAAMDRITFCALRRAPACAACSAAADPRVGDTPTTSKLALGRF